jgi:hypothetical protein
MGERQEKVCKLTPEDRTDGYALIVERVISGHCAIPGCQETPQIDLSYRFDGVPLFCDSHQGDGTFSHFGEWGDIYEPDNRRTVTCWSCCKYNWKMSNCSLLREALMVHAAEIPVTEEQRENLRIKERRAEEQAEENRRMEAMYSAGHDEYYDR